MYFKKLRIKNIRSYEDEEINFPLGSILLSGEVGSGKTSILLAIEYALFGLQPGQKGNIFLRNSADYGEVALEFCVGEKNISIERRLKRTQKGISNEYAALTVDGNRTESSLTEIKSKIVELLGYPPEFIKKNNLLYRYTVHSPQERMKQIILEDPETRLTILRHVFGIDKYRTIKENCALLSTKLKYNSKILQAELKSLEEDKINLAKRNYLLSSIIEKKIIAEREVKGAIEEREKCEADIREIEKKINEKIIFEKEVEKANILLSSKKENLASFKEEMENILKAFKQYILFDENLYNFISKNLNEKKILIEKSSAKSVEITSNLKSLNNEKKELERKKENIFKLEFCPTCLQDVPHVHKHNILNDIEQKISEINKAVETLEKENKGLLENISKYLEEAKNLEQKKLELEIRKSQIAQIEKMKEKKSELEKNIVIIEKDIGLLNEHITNLKEKLLAFSPLEGSFKMLEKILREAVIKEKNSLINFAEIKKEIELTQRDIEFYLSEIKKKEAKQKELYELEIFVDWLSTEFISLVELVERRTLLKLRAEFSGLFKKLFLTLVPDNEFDSQIDENFTPVILSRGIEMDYEFLSGGERTAVALAYRIALNQTINSMMSDIRTKGLIILDEPTDGFSEAQIMKLREIIHDLKTEQIIVVSHEQSIEGFVNNVLKVVKDGDASKVLVK